MRLAHVSFILYNGPPKTWGGIIPLLQKD